MNEVTERINSQIYNMSKLILHKTLHLVHFYVQTI